MKDLRLIQVEEREGFAQLLSGIVLIVVGGAMLLAGVFAAAKIGAAIPQDDFSAAQNTTFDNIKNNIFDALELVGVVLIIIGVVLLVQGVRAMGS